MFYLLGAIVLVVVVVVRAQGAQAPFRFRLLVASLGALGLAVLCVAFAGLTGNVGVFYLGALLIALGLPLTVAMLVGVYRDRRTTAI